MNILKYSREQVKQFIDDGIMKPENLRHYDICKEIEAGKKTQGRLAQEFEISETKTIRNINKTKCPSCHFPMGNSRKNILK